MKQALIFDLDGTLWDTTKQLENIWNNMLISYNIDTKNFTISSIIKMSYKEIMSNLFDDNYIIFNSFLKDCLSYENNYLTKNGANIYPNTISTIKKLSSKFDLYIVSNCHVGYIESFLDYYKLNNFFKDYECIGKTHMPKDKNLISIMNRNKINTSIYVGDTQEDYIAATKSNNKFIWAKYGFGICNNYDYCINDISDLLSILF